MCAVMMLVKRKHTSPVKGQSSKESEAGDDDVKKLRVLQPFARPPVLFSSL